MTPARVLRRRAARVTLIRGRLLERRPRIAPPPQAAAALTVALPALAKGATMRGTAAVEVAPDATPETAGRA